MDSTPLIWLNGKLIPWAEANVHVLTHGLHYGSGVFEGIRFYETSTGSAIFRLQEHIERLFFSAEALKMEIPFSISELSTATQEVVRRSGVNEGYIRPLAFYGSGKMGLNPTGAGVDVMIACWPWGKYLADRPLRAKVSSYIRIHPQSTIASAKICGHYVNSILASQEAIAEKYDEAILLDYEGNVAEGPAENIFLIKEGVMATPSLGNVLRGITRDSVIQIAKDFGIMVQERPIAKAELFTADELFFTGTAVEIAPIGSVDEQRIGNGEEGDLTRKIREKYMQAVRGAAGDYASWLTKI